MRTVIFVKSAKILFRKKLLIGTDQSTAKTMSWSHLSRTNSTPHPPLERLWQSSRTVHVAPDLVCHSSTSPHAYKSCHFGAPNSLHVEPWGETLLHARVRHRRLRLHALTFASSRTVCWSDVAAAVSHALPRQNPDCTCGFRSRCCFSSFV